MKIKNMQKGHNQAYLIKQGEEIRKIHDLTALVIDCEKYDTTFQELEPLVEGITDFAVEFRYPEDNGGLQRLCIKILEELERLKRARMGPSITEEEFLKQHPDLKY